MNYYNGRKCASFNCLNTVYYKYCYHEYFSVSRLIHISVDKVSVISLPEGGLEGRT